MFPRGPAQRRKRFNFSGRSKPLKHTKAGAVIRKASIATASVLTLALAGSVFWPTLKPDVERLGDSAYETIWLWRIPAYAGNPSWRVRWSWNDPLRAEARCCRAL